MTRHFSILPVVLVAVIILKITSSSSCGAALGATNTGKSVHAYVVVYGGTPAGIMAAVAAARHGHTVALIDLNHHLGGVVSGGLCETDMGDRKTVGGLAGEFFDRVVKYYTDKYGPDSSQVQTCKGGVRFEPSIAE